MAESSMSLGVSETEISALKEALCAQQQLLQKLYNEVDVEREASSTAASEALSMILRLQGEKATVKMEASQYKRMSEEKLCHAEEALAIFEDLIYQKEMEIASLDYQVQAYRHKLLSLGVTDPGIDETKFPENLLQRNENFVGDIQSISRRNSLPPIPFKYPYHKKGIIEKERSASPDLVPKVIKENTNRELNIQSLDMEKKPENYAVGDIISYWEQIRKLDEQVRDIVDFKGIKSANLRGRSRSSLLLSQGAVTTKLGKAKHPENLLENEATTDSACSSSVHDVFEVPQTHGNGKCRGQQTKEQDRLNLEGDERLGKPDSVSQEVVKDETDCVKKVQLSSHHGNYNLRRTSDGGSVDSHFTLVHPTIGVAESHAKFLQLDRTSEIIEVGRQVVRQESTNRGEEEINLLNEIKEQLNSIQFEIRSWTTKKSSPPDELPLVSLTEAMMVFWL
uniref:GTD-binding domain-containing protein n=1 Tax=Davidia involucrata TaxID=16924 RepID=A0A5B7B3X3_DAVIN